MKVNIQRGELLKALQKIQGVVEKRNTMPILGHVLLEAEGDLPAGQAGTVTLFATDLEIGIKSAHPAKVMEKGAVTLAGRKFYEIIRELAEEEVYLEKLENHGVLIESGASRFKVMGLPVEEYPVQPPSPAQPLLPIPHGILLELIQRTLFAVGENDARYILNGVLLELRPAGEHRHFLRLVGTDGHRLALAEKEFESQHTSFTSGGSNEPAGEGAEKTPARPAGGDALSVIVPKKTLSEVKRLLGEEDQDPEVGFANNQMLFRQGNLILFSRLMEGTFPNYQQVIPKDNEKHVVVGRRPLEGALKRVSLLSREKTHAVKLQIEAGRICLSSSNPELGEAREDLPIPYQGEGMSAGFNARYLLDVLGVMKGEEALFEFKDALSPCLVREPKPARSADRDQNHLCVVMPMRV
jgi:DNA polymerase-3 subunit beta